MKTAMRPTLSLRICCLQAGWAFQWRQEALHCRCLHSRIPCTGMPGRMLVISASQSSLDPTSRSGQVLTTGVASRKSSDDTLLEVEARVATLNLLFSKFGHLLFFFLLFCFVVVFFFVLLLLGFLFLSRFFLFFGLALVLVSVLRLEYRLHMIRPRWMVGDGFLIRSAISSLSLVVSMSLRCGTILSLKSLLDMRPHIGTRHFLEAPMLLHLGLQISGALQNGGRLV